MQRCIPLLILLAMAVLTLTCGHASAGPLPTDPFTSASQGQVKTPPAATICDVCITCTCPNCGCTITTGQMKSQAVAATKPAPVQQQPVVTYAQPVSYSQPVYYSAPSYPQPVYLSSGGGGSCANGQCGGSSSGTVVQSRGLFGGIIRR